MFLLKMRVCVLQYAPAVKVLNLAIRTPVFKATPSIVSMGFALGKVRQLLESIKPRLPSPIFKATCFIGTKGLVLGKVPAVENIKVRYPSPVFRATTSSVSMALCRAMHLLWETNIRRTLSRCFSIQQTNPPPCCRRSCPAHSGNGFTLYLHCIYTLRWVLLSQAGGAFARSERRACIG
jgi:hypothetical protein